MFCLILLQLQLYPTTVHVTAVVVQYETPTGRTNKGVATTWLKDKTPPVNGEGDYPVAPIFIRKSQFRLVLIIIHFCLTVSCLISLDTGKGSSPIVN